MILKESIGIFQRIREYKNFYFVQEIFKFETLKSEHFKKLDLIFAKY